MPDFGFEQRAVIDGDCRCAAISAASILAKVSRDRYMRRVAERHPHWDFDTNVGYSTPEHRAAIASDGISPIHRLSFAVDRLHAARAGRLAHPPERPLQVLEREQPALRVEADRRPRRTGAPAAGALDASLAEPPRAIARTCRCFRTPIEANGPSTSRVAIRTTRVFTSQKTSARASRATTSSSPYRVRKFRSTISNPTSLEMPDGQLLATSTEPAPRIAHRAVRSQPPRSRRTR